MAHGSINMDQPRSAARVPASAALLRRFRSSGEGEKLIDVGGAHD